ncbi:hypothetical protein MNB_SM-3-1546 [hydrothermal vent metagenome]|uniref:Methyltransferase domain-containing protein n=1 Tax=hydrothermal vent metagenome TaxID=652676 RepID=A0A1W1D2S6_9ZZZZ
MLIFTNESLFEIITSLESLKKNLSPKSLIEFQVLNPDIATSTYNGNIITIENQQYIYRGYKTWIDLAQTLHCRMLTPKLLSHKHVIIRYEMLNETQSFHQSTTQKEEKYGIDSLFSQIHKNEESAFLTYYLQALKNVNIQKRLHILNLGINSGDEFEIIQKYAPNFKQLQFTGIDYCPSAINEAKKRFAMYPNITFYQHDINELHQLNLPKFDLIMSIGTLQSSNISFNQTIMNLVQNYLKKDGAMILGFPNCRWIDGEMIYGAKPKNYNFSEMSLVYKDVMFCKKYLQQKKFRVTITGKDYIFLTATAI